MLDKYIKGSVERISPESPVQVVSVSEESFVPGGASNVCNNISALGAKTSIVGAVGKDKSSEIFKKELKKGKIESLIVEDKNRPTTEKVRIIGRGQQLLRIDYERSFNYNTNIYFRYWCMVLGECFCFLRVGFN